MMLRTPRGTTVRQCHAFAAVALIAAALAFSPAVATAAEIDLGTIGFGAVIVDNAHEHVLISGPKANVVDVLNFSGELVATIPEIYGAYGMVIDKNKLYVVESTTGSVVAINLKTLKVRKKPIVTGLVRPRWIAVSGDALWVTTATGSESSVLASVNLASQAYRQFPETYTNPDLATSPGDQDDLFLAVDGDSPGSIYRFDVSSGAPKLVASNTSLNQENIKGLAISPDGTRVIPAAGWPYDFEELSARTLQPDGFIYPGQAYPVDVAVSGRQANLLATGSFASRHDNVIVDPIGKPEPIFEATTQSENLAPHGLALSADGRSLFAVSYGPNETDTLLNTYEVP